MFATVRIRQHERGLLFRYGDFRQLLGPGKYRLWNPLWSRTRAVVEIFDTLDTLFPHPLLDVLLTHEDVREVVRVVDLKDDERALVWRDERLVHIVGAGRHALWKTPHRLEIEVFNVQDFRFEHPRLHAVWGHPDGARHLETVRVAPNTRALLMRENQLADVLEPGAYLFWKQASGITWTAIDVREQVADVAGQEIMTGDKVTLRVNLLVTYQVQDVVKAATVTSDYQQSLYREAQLALRAAVGTRSLDALLADKNAIGGEVADALARRAADLGVVVKSVGLRDIILPGEMKAILNQVITAEKQAQANLIKRREETAAARSQANTAKLLAENPVLRRIKELELLQDMLAGSKATLVLGSGDIVGQVRSLIREEHGSA